MQRVIPQRWRVPRRSVGARLSRRALMQRAVGAGLSGFGLTLLAGCRNPGRPTVTAGAEPPPETTRLRLSYAGATCIAPQLVAEELLKGEGFTEVQYVRTPVPTKLSSSLASGEVDISMSTVGLFASWIDAGLPIVILAGVHSGCYELFGTEQVRTIRDLKGRNVAIPAEGGAHQIFLSSMAAHIGVDARKEITWVVAPFAEGMQLLADGRVAAYIGFPPEPQELRARGIGHVVVNTTTDKPWSQYFCCMIATSREFMRRNPVATKRALRAILKAADLCTSEPERVARRLVDRGFSQRYDYALQVLTELPYSRWRQDDPADTVRFHTLRLQEAGLVKSSPKTIISRGTDWRFLNELKKELKG